LHEARDLAAEGGDVALVVAVASFAETSYEVEALAWIAEAFEAVQKRTQPVAVSKQIAKTLLPKIDDAVRDEAFEIADRLMAVAMAAGRKAQDPALLKSV